MTKIASLCYAGRQGLGWLMKRYYDAGVITHPIIYRHSNPSRKTLTEWYPPGTPVVEGRNPDRAAIREVLKQVEVLYCFETFFDWGLVDVAREMGVKTCLQPMYEWTPTRWPAKPDYIHAPSLLDRDYFKDEFPGKCLFIPVPVENSTWQLRKTAVRWLHNAGNVGHREHKGTRQLVEAIPLVKNPDWRLTIKAQDGKALTSILEGTPAALRDPRVTIDLNGEQPWERMWDDHDVYVAPEKLNGLSLPLAEAYAAGMPVMTTARYPMTTWMPTEPMIPVERYEKARIGPNYRELDEAIVTPEAIASKIDSWVGRDITDASLRSREWGVANSWPVLKPLYDEFFARVARGEDVS